MRGTSFGAISVVNAIACGIGATIGIDLRTDAEFITDIDDTRVIIMNDPGIDDNLIHNCIRRTLERISEDPYTPYRLTVNTQIPPSRGLKSSSSICNAVIYSILKEYGVEMDEMEVLRMGVECARESGVTITGAFDDACGCHYGGIVFTDNTSNELLRRYDIPNYDVILWIPDKVIPKNQVQVDAYMKRRSQFEDVLALAYEDPLAALTKNGELLAEIIGSDMKIEDLALSNGALAAGISGTGPAVAIVCHPKDGDEIERMIGGNTIRTRTR